MGMTPKAVLAGQGVCYCILTICFSFLTHPYDHHKVAHSSRPWNWAHVNVNTLKAEIEFCFILSYFYWFCLFMQLPLLVHCKVHVTNYNCNILRPDGIFFFEQTSLYKHVNYMAKSTITCIYKCSYLVDI